jgi:predicted 3-demethylubiquinone-9 3-methyltransferase (glyoxalase superfamily)
MECKSVTHATVFDGALAGIPRICPSPGAVQSGKPGKGVRPFVALNGGPDFTFSEAVSFQVLCDTQKELDMFWSKLSEGGQEGQCGWLKDKFGLSWQIVPSGVKELFANPDTKKAEAAMKTMLGMKKLDLADMQRARARDQP